MPRRVLFVTTKFDQVTNGPGVYAQNLWNFFSEETDIDFHLVALESTTQHDNLHTLGYQPQGFGSATYTAISNLASEVLQELGPETILHANMAHAISPELAASYPSIVQINDTEVCGWRPTLANLKRYGLRRNGALCWRKKREKAVVKSANTTICNSQYTASTVRRAYQMPTSRVGLIYKAIDLKPFKNAARAANKSTSSSRQEILFVGENWRRKGLDTLLKAISLLKTGQPEIRLRIYGKPDLATRQEFANLAEQLGITDHISFEGHIDRDDLPSALACADILALPSYEEALGLVAIEALATGIPVVASNVGGIPEIIINPTCGRLTAAGNAAAFAEATRKVLDYPLDPTDISSRQASVARFSATRLKDELLELYATVSGW